MISDEMLEKAAAEAASIINNSLPNPNLCSHQFSNSFERKIKRLTRKANHPVLYRTLRNIACIALMLLIGFGSILTVSAEARELVFGWVKQQYESFYEYFFEGEPSSSETAKYSPGWLPDEYDLATTYEITGGEAYIYTNEQGTIIQFSYSSSLKETALFLETVEYELHTVKVNDNLAEVYIASDDTETNAIIWIDSTQDILFYISAPLNQDELIKMAESIVIKDIKK